MNKLKILFNGILKENPTFVLVLGMCPTLGVTTSAVKGSGMGIAIVDVLIQGFVPALGESLGLFIPLIVVNCIVLGRAEAFASKNTVFDSMLDGIGMGLGFTLSLTVIGAIREILGSGSIFGYTFLPASTNILVFVLAPGAFFVLGFVMAFIRHLQNSNEH